MLQILENAPGVLLRVRRVDRDANVASLNRVFRGPYGPPLPQLTAALVFGFWVMLKAGAKSKLTLRPVIGQPKYCFSVANCDLVAPTIVDGKPSFRASDFDFERRSNEPVTASIDRVSIYVSSGEQLPDGTK